MRGFTWPPRSRGRKRSASRRPSFGPVARALHPAAPFPGTEEIRAAAEPATTRPGGFTPGRPVPGTEERRRDAGSTRAEELQFGRPVPGDGRAPFRFPRVSAERTLQFGRPVPGTEELSYLVDRLPDRRASIRPPRSRDGRAEESRRKSRLPSFFTPAAPFPGRKRTTAEARRRPVREGFNSAAPFPGRKSRTQAAAFAGERASIRPPRSRDGRGGGVAQSGRARSPAWRLHSGRPVPGRKSGWSWGWLLDGSCFNSAAPFPGRKRPTPIAAPFPDRGGFNSAAPFPGRKSRSIHPIEPVRHALLNSAAPFPGRKSVFAGTRLARPRWGFTRPPRSRGRKRASREGFYRFRESFHSGRPVPGTEEIRVLR